MASSKEQLTEPQLEVPEVRAREDSGSGWGKLDDADGTVGANDMDQSLTSIVNEGGLYEHATFTGKQ